MAPRVELDIYGRTNDELGFPPEVEDDEAGELLARSTLARSSCSVSRSTTPATSTAGSAASPYSINCAAPIGQMDDLLGYSTSRGQRQPLAAVLTEASALAGWEALDRNAI
jgi:hypothetical protein